MNCVFCRHVFIIGYYIIDPLPQKGAIIYWENHLSLLRVSSIFKSIQSQPIEIDKSLSIFFLIIIYS